MFHRIEAHIRPILKHGKKAAIEVNTLEERKEEFENIYSVGNMLKKDRRGRIIGAGTSLILATAATIELSKVILPLISPETAPLNRWHPVLEQISTITETPIAVGILAAIGAFYVGKSALYDRFRVTGIRRAFNRVEGTPADYPGDHIEHTPGEYPNDH